MPGAEAGAGEGREARALLLIAAVALCALCGGGSLLLFYVAPLDQPAPPAHLSDISSSPPSTPKYSSFSRLCKYINCSGLAPTTKTILLWNSPTLDDNLGYGPSKGISIFQDVSCRPNDCFMTANLSLMPVVAYDAVVVSNIPPVDAPVSKERRPEQRYIFYMPKPGSSPLTALYAYEEKLPRYYNWTMSYRLDSDIIFPRGQGAEQQQPGAGGVVQRALRAGRGAGQAGGGAHAVHARGRDGQVPALRVAARPGPPARPVRPLRLLPGDGRPGLPALRDGEVVRLPAAGRPVGGVRLRPLQRAVPPALLHRREHVPHGGPCGGVLAVPGPAPRRVRQVLLVEVPLLGGPPPSRQPVPPLRAAAPAAAAQGLRQRMAVLARARPVRCQEGFQSSGTASVLQTKHESRSQQFAIVDFYE